MKKLTFVVLLALVAMSMSCWAEPPSSAGTPDYQTREAAEDAARVLPQLVTRLRVLEAANRGGSYTREIVRQRIIIREKVRKLSPKELTQTLRKMGYWGSSAKWARRDINHVLAENILYGRKTGTTQESEEWRSPAQKQELAAGLSRVDGRAEERLNRHNFDPNAHTGIVAAVNDRIKRSSFLGNLAFWLLMGLLLLAFLWWLWRRLFCCPAPAPAPFATPGVVPPIVPGGAGGAPAYVGITPARNNTGIWTQ